MFYIGQIVYDCEYSKPIVAYYSDHGRETHFIRASGDRTYEVALPESTLEASTLMANGVIFPAPLSLTHCPKCFGWKSNHKADGSCENTNPEERKRFMIEYGFRTE